MFQIGPLELAVVLVIALIVLGPQRLPDVARSVGRGMREFRTALNDESRDDEHEPYEEPEDDEPADEGPKKLEAAHRTDAQGSQQKDAAAAHRDAGQATYQKDAESSESSSSSSERV